MEFKECLIFCPLVEMNLHCKITNEENEKLLGRHLRSIIRIPSI